MLFSWCSQTSRICQMPCQLPRSQKSLACTTCATDSGSFSLHVQPPAMASTKVWIGCPEPCPQRSETLEFSLLFVECVHRECAVHTLSISTNWTHVHFFA